MVLLLLLLLLFLVGRLFMQLTCSESGDVPAGCCCYRVVRRSWEKYSAAGRQHEDTDTHT